MFLLIGAIGASVMYLLANLLSMSDNRSLQVTATLAIIALGIVVPYWMMKFGFNRAHSRHKGEMEFH